MLDSILDTDPEVKVEANSFMSSAKEPFGPFSEVFPAYLVLVQAEKISCLVLALP